MLTKPNGYALMALGCLCLSACGKPTQGNTGALVYELRKDGIVVEASKNTYESIGDTTFTRTQKYTVTYVGADKSAKNRLLAVKLLLRVGGKDVREDTGVIVIQDGVGKLECSHYYDVKIVNYDQAPDPVCTITSLGDAALSAANLQMK